MSGRLRLGEERRDRALSVRLDRTLRIIREVYRGEASACDLDADPPALASAFEFPGPADVDVGAVGSSVILSGSREDLPGLVGQAWSWEDEPHPGGVRLDRVGERIGLLERRAGGVEVAEVDRRGVALGEVESSDQRLAEAVDRERAQAQRWPELKPGSTPHLGAPEPNQPKCSRLEVSPKSKRSFGLETGHLAGMERASGAGVDRATPTAVGTAKPRTFTRENGGEKQSAHVSRTLRQASPTCADLADLTRTLRGGYLTRLSILNIGRYMLMMITPTITPTPTIISGSTTEVSAWIEASTSSS